MPGSKRRREGVTETYKRIRKPVPPPTKVDKDRRRKIREEQSRREVEEELERRVSRS